MIEPSFPYWPETGGRTANVVVTATSADLTLPVTTSPHKQSSVRLANNGANWVFVRWDGTTPTVGNGMPLAPNSVEVFGIEGSVTTIKAIAAGTGNTLYATVGIGE